jgi:hypothetical protein
VHTALDTVPRHVLHDLLVRGITPPLPSPPLLLLLLLLLLRCLGPTDAALPGTTGSSAVVAEQLPWALSFSHCTALLCSVLSFGVWGGCGWGRDV